MRPTNYWALSSWHMAARRAATGCTTQWSDEWQSPFYECVGSAPGNRTQGWFDDARSTRAKVALARRLGLGGWGVFDADQVGDDVADMWAALRS